MKLPILIVYMTIFAFALFLTGTPLESGIYTFLTVLAIGLIWWAIDNVDAFPWTKLRTGLHKILCALGWHDSGRFADGVFCYWCSTKLADIQERTPEVGVDAYNEAKRRNPNCTDPQTLIREATKILDETSTKKD